MKYLITLSILIISFICICQEEEQEGESRDDKFVLLLQKIKSEKTIVLFENEDITVETSLELFEEHINQWLEKHPRLTMDKKLLELIKEEARTKDRINAKNIAKGNKLKPRLKFRVADMLEEGKCLITDKNSGTAIKKIKVQTYIFYCGPLCGNGGRRFFVQEKKFFEVMDWIS